MARVPFLVLLALVLGGTTACQQGASAHGAQARWIPRPARVHRSLWRAATHPRTWVPAAGALALGLSGLDEDVVDWASRETPVFGSVESADRWSARLRNALRVATPVTLALTDAGRTPGRAVPNKLRAATAQAGAWWLTGTVTNAVKDEARRERPNGANRRSFPSDRASEASVLAQMGRDNLAWIRPLPRWGRTVGRAALTTAEVLVAWGRVEAAAHHPSDVLAGMALGHALGHVTDDLFLGTPRVRAGPVRGPRGEPALGLSVGWRE